MKQFIISCIALLVATSLLQAQRLDPHSTPPGAPIYEHAVGNGANRLMPNHPGNAGQRVTANNFTIIESSTGGHTMDVVWSNLLTSMGHTPTIAPQATLNTTGFFAGTHALIISSGTIALSGAAVTTIRQFVQTGKPVYIQGEYLPTYSTNIAFQTIVNATGGTFATGGTVNGSLVPTNILNLYSATPNIVTSLGYHWYGCTGSGCNNIEYFMRYGADNIGYVYCPTNGAWGDVIQSSDQDWVQQSMSLPLMQNIVFAMLSGNACSVVCGTVLSATHLEVQATPQAFGVVELDWILDGELPAGRFEIWTGDEKLGEMRVGEAAGMHFTWQDQRMRSGMQHYSVRYYDLNGQASLRGETMIDLGQQPAHLRVATESTGLRVWLSEGHTCSQLFLVDVAGRRFSLDREGVCMPVGQPISMTGFAPGMYWLQGETTDGQYFDARVVWIQ